MCQFLGRGIDMESDENKAAINDEKLDDGIAIQKEQQKLKSAIDKVKPFLKDIDGEEFTHKVYTVMNYAMHFAIEHEKEYSVTHVDKYDIIGFDFLAERKRSRVNRFHKELSSVIDGFIINEGQREYEALWQVIDDISKPMTSEIVGYIYIYNRENIIENGERMRRKTHRLTTDMPDLAGIINTSYEKFHDFLNLNIERDKDLDDDNVYKIKAPNVVITDPPYFIGKADWDKPSEKAEKVEEFKKYLISANSVLADDGMFIIFNTKQNVELLAEIIKDLSQNDNYPTFNYRVDDYHEWVKTNPNHKMDKQYTERSEFLLIAWRDNELGRARHEKIKNNYRYGLDNEIFESAALTKPFDETNGKRGKRINETPKPPRMIEKLIQRLTFRDDVLLDSFAGSASIAIAGYDLGHKVYSCELSPYTQIKATNRLKRFKRVVGQRVLRDEPSADMIEFYWSVEDEELADKYFEPFLNRLNLAERVKYANSKLKDILERYRKAYAKRHGNTKKALENAEISTKIEEENLSDADRGFLIGFSSVWGNEFFEQEFGFNNRDQNKIERYFDPIALNMALRYRQHYILDHLSADWDTHISKDKKHVEIDWSEYLKGCAEALSDNKQRPTVKQLVSYELYLLQLLNSFVLYEDKLQRLQYDMNKKDYLGPENSVKKHEANVNKIYAFYRILAILVDVLAALDKWFDSKYRNLLAEYDKGNVDEEQLNKFKTQMVDRCYMRSKFNNEEDIDRIIGEQLDIRRKNSLYRSGQEEKVKDYLTSDSGNELKSAALREGDSYFKERLAQHFKSKGRVVEIPTLTPENVGKTLKLTKTDLIQYKFYAVIGKATLTESGNVTWSGVRGEYILEYPEGKQAQKAYLLQVIKELVNEGLSTIQISKMLMLTQGTINNYRKELKKGESNA